VLAALIFRQLDQRCVPRLDALQRGVADWKPKIIANLGSREAF